VARGVSFIVLALNKSGKSSGTLRPTALRFDAEGLSIDVAFAPPFGRRYGWRSIRRIDDVGDSFVLVPTFGKRIVLPKRAFPDRGREAWAFFAMHGVAGRGPHLQPATARS
jgi:hypothetical protein